MSTYPGFMLVQYSTWKSFSFESLNNHYCLGSKSHLDLSIIVQCSASLCDLVSFTMALTDSIPSSSFVAFLDVNTSFDEMAAFAAMKKIKVPSYNVLTLWKLSTVLDNIEDVASLVLFVGACIVVDYAEEVCTAIVQNKLKGTKPNFDLSLSLVA